MIKGIIFLKDNELKLISFYTEKLIPLNIKSQKKLDIIRSRFTKQNLLLCDFKTRNEIVEIHPIHFVQLKTKTDNKLFDVGKLPIYDIVSLAYQGAILLQKNMKKEDSESFENAISSNDSVESGFD